MPTSSRPLRRRSLIALVLTAAGCATSGPPSSAQSVPQSAAVPPPAVTSGAQPAAPSPAAAADAQYRALWAAFLPEYLRREPVDATALGNHDHDGEWPDLSVQARDADNAFYAEVRRKLAAIDVGSLSPDARLDAETLADKLDLLALRHDEIKPEENDPHDTTEILGAGLDALVTRDFAPAPVRAASLARRLAGIEKVTAVARVRLGRPPRIATETAIRQTRGLLGLVEGGFKELLADAPAQKAEVLAAAASASKSLHALQAFFEGELLARSDGSFRAGPARFRKILELTLDHGTDPEALVAKARGLLAETQGEMERTARELWPTLFPGVPAPDANSAASKRAVVRKVLDRLAQDRPTNATIVKNARDLLAQATDFARKNDLVTLPDQPAKVMELPEYRRGVAIAYCDWAGPLETHAETHVSISPVPSDWPPARVTSFYREYNASMLADLMVHEAMPGHYLQGAHAAALGAVARAVFTNDAFVEGWAVYAEWLMAAHGFGGPAVRMQRLKMLARVCANTILDHDIHAGSMDEKAALDLMENEAFQEEGEAALKWNRARLSQGQLSQYMYGFVELLAARQAAEKLPGFSERAYHDRVLSFGAPSVKRLRARLGV